MSIIIGFEVDILDVVKDIKQYLKDHKETGAKYREHKKNKIKALENKMIETRKKADELDSKLKEMESNLLDKTEDYFALRREKNDLEIQLSKEKEDAKISTDWREHNKVRKEFKQAESVLKEADKEIKKSYKENFNAITVAEQGLNSAKKNAYKALTEYLKDKKGFKQKIGKVKELFKQGGVSGGGFGFDLDFSLLGTLELSYTNWNVVKLTVYAELQFKPSYTYQWFIPTPIGPIPLFIKIEGLIGFRVEAIFVDEAKSIPIIEAFEKIQFVLQLGLRVDGGIGIGGIASAGPYGKVQFNFNFTKKQIEFVWAAGVKLQFLMFELEFGYQSEPIILAGDKSSSANSSMNLMSRMSTNDSCISENQLFERIYQSSRPQLIQMDNNRRMLIWIEDDANRDDYNRSVLKYSINENNLWSIPQAVCNNGTADFAYDVSLKGNDVYIAVQKSKRIIDGDDTIESVLEKIEIYATKYNSQLNSFDEINQITNNNFFDAAPQFGVDTNASNDAVLFWQTNTNNDYLGLTGENVIYSSTFKQNNWTKAEEQFRNDMMIYNYSAAVNGNECSIAACVDVDGDIFTADALTIVKQNGIVVMTENGAMNPCFINLKSSVGLMYYDGKSLKLTEDFINDIIVSE